MTEETNNIFQEKVFFRKLRSQVDGNAKVKDALTQIKGIGRILAQTIIKIAEVNPNVSIGSIPEKDLNRLEEIIIALIENGIPKWMVNRPKDLLTGKDLHIIGNKIDLLLNYDIERMKKIKSYKGIRKRLGLKVRGQRTNRTLVKFLNQILDLMELRNSNDVIIGLDYISELLDPNFLEDNKLSEDVINYLESKSISVTYQGNFIRFLLAED
ncbi:MAG: 30S ribosomal protein S13 [Promethearchaeota archaeon]